MPPLTLDRRDALKLLASGTATVMAGCSPPDEEIIPYADMPEGLVAGEPQRFATALSLSGYGRGFLGICVDGRPIKIEGNPGHPFSLGATDVFAEGEVLSLYDPDRARVVRHNDQIATWDALVTAWKKIPADAGIGLVTGRITSPTTLRQIKALQQAYSGLRWYRYEAVNEDAEREGARQAFGRLVSAQPDWQRVDRILCLDADPLGPGPDLLRVARPHGLRRAAGSGPHLYVAEPAWTLTGAAADFRLPLQPHLIAAVCCSIANELGAGLPHLELPVAAQAFVARASKELQAASGRALVLVGSAQPPQMHALCHWINQRLRAPVLYRAPLDDSEVDHGATLKQLSDDLATRRLDALIVLGANPVYDAPDGWKIGKSIAKLPYSLHAGTHPNETTTGCGWQAPLTHVLESWADVRATDGTASLVQPLIRPLYDTRTSDELLALLVGRPAKAYDLVRATWSPQAKGDFETWWRQVLHDGVIPGTAMDPVSLPAPRLPQISPTTAPSSITLVLSPHPSVWDGRFADNAWLQECPAPFSKQVWGNALSLAPEDAARIGVKDGDSVAVTIAGQTTLAPITVMPGQAQGVVASHWGHGRMQAGHIGSGVGIRWIGMGGKPFPRLLTVARIEKTSNPVGFRSTQTHTRLQGSAEELFKIAGRQTEQEKEPPSLLTPPQRGEYAWAMVVDTDACIGCNACVVACQAENNVPVVGPEEISQGRDMHWLRVDSYAVSDDGKARRGFQPVPCMHCELAPCEPVCPVEASVHDHEGLNVQVYNRCIGTRFCEANCPYKVRRFNWFAYAGEQAYANQAAALKAQHNPDVSARGRGVMEKCNYCLQRISRARKTAEKEDRPVAEGEMITACQAACPTRAIHFGDLNRPDSDVSRQRQKPRHYTLLAELNTRPRTTYLKRVYADDEEKPP